jgi:glycosyltransferase involved in cell wall biosynthesis
MASGLPVLVSNRCGCADDLVEEGLNGFVFDPDESAALTAHLLTIGGLGEGALAGMRRSSREIVARYSPNSGLRRLLTLPATEFSQAIEQKAQASKATGVWLQVAAHLDPKFGGISACVPPLAQATEAHGRHLAPVAVFCDPEEDTSHIERRNVQVFRFPSGRSAWMRNSTPKERLRSLVEASDGVHIHGIWGQHSAVAANLAREMGKPYIVTAHGMLEPWALRQKRLKKSLYSMMVERPNLQGASCVHALTHAEVEDYRGFNLRNPVAVIPNGVDIVAGASPDLFLEKWPHLKGRRLVLFLSRLHRKKGLDILCQTWSRIRRKFPEYHLVLAGPDCDDTRASTEELVDMLDMRDGVTFTGMLSGKMKWSALAAAEVFVLPSYSEGFSMAVLEAMAMALPVIVTRPCNFPEIAELDCGSVVEPEARQLESALLSMLTAGVERRRKMGRNGRDLILARYTWERIGQQLSELYDWVLNGQMPTGVPIYRSAYGSPYGSATADGSPGATR